MRYVNTVIKILTFAIAMIFISCNETKHPQLSNSRFQLSLAQWSFHNELFEHKMDNFDFVRVADSLGFEGVEFVDQFLVGKAKDSTYLSQLKDTLAYYNITPLLIMIDLEGDLASPDGMERNKSVDNHKKWINAAQFLGCHSIRVNLFGDGDSISVTEASIDALTKLSNYASNYPVNIIVENHGGLSSNGKWLSDVVKKVNKTNCGTLPDFDNFCLMREGNARWSAPCIKEYPRYMGVEELLPFAKGISAKSFAFNENGEETSIDYKKMMELINASAYTGFIGIEYEGEELSSIEGIQATKNLLLQYFPTEF